ncbi:MAG: phosphatidylglycerophosphatase A [Syntrophales bacterium]|nr:phosphatidylglycerophosphatase A [Syntrophales bacterium]MCK9528145.1 phosphatidylglycerophosphatase A [Syntrophales bacterium]MDX9921115.1 phosphatidylglycerophosphatase A [Syntrophales bacterium]
MKRDPMGVTFIKIAATGLGVGMSPVAPGTLGTIVGIPLYLVFSVLPPPLCFLCVLVFIFFAVHVSAEAERLFRERDSSKIVIDEIAGYLVVMMFVPPSVFTVVAGFLLFRFFDILKPFPIRIIEKRLPGGFGVVGDDVAAGIYGAVILNILIRLI